MRRTGIRSLATLALALLGACTQTKGPTEAPSPKTEEGSGFRFDWKAPCMVPVTETALKKGQTAKMSYRIVLTPARDGKELHLRMVDWKFLEVNGQDSTSPEMKEELREAVAMTSAIPTLRISPEGDYLGATGVEEMVDRVIAQRSVGRKEIDEKARQVMLSPRAVAQLELKMGDDWNRWVGAWAGVELEPHATLDFEKSLPAADQEIPITGRYSHLGDVKGIATGRLVRLRQESKVDLKAASPAIDSLVAEALAQELVGGQRSLTLEADTDPATLRPARSSSDQLITVRLKDGSETSRRETKETHFPLFSRICSRSSIHAALARRA